MGRLGIEASPFDVQETLESLGQMFLPVARHKGLAFRIALDPALPRTVAGDRTRLQQVLGNLLGNAFKFTKEGHVTLGARPLPDSGEDVHRILFTVEDTGVGIPADELKTVFGAFTQADANYNRRYQGPGLGLALSEKLVSLMRGTISATSEAGVGTRFSVVLPLPPVEPGQTRPAPDEPPAERGESLKILLAEDDEVSRTYQKVLLEAQGHRVVMAVNGKLALEACPGSPSTSCSWTSRCP